jgi:hypothetical protein
VSAEVRTRSGTGLGTLLAVIAVGALAVGIVSAVGSQVTSGATETGAGAYVTEHPLAYWGWHATELTTIPAAVPPAVSTTVGAPTHIGRVAASYVINAAVAGQTAVAWVFEESTAAPDRTELAITFVDGLSSAATTITVYLETAPRAPGAALTFTFYWDAGTFAPESLEIETMTGTVQACTAVGDCP